MISGSKMVAKLNGKISASGGYSTYLCWLRETGSKALTCPTNTDIDTFIDNIGTVIHNYVNHDVLFQILECSITLKISENNETSGVLRHVQKLP